MKSFSPKKPIKPEFLKNLHHFTMEALKQKYTEHTRTRDELVESVKRRLEPLLEDLELIEEQKQKILKQIETVQKETSKVAKHDEKAKKYAKRIADLMIAQEQ